MTRLAPLALLAAVSLIPIAASAQDAHGSHHADAAVVRQPMAMTNGIVRRVDKAAGSVTITHGPLANLGMPAMTMTFQVKERAWLDHMKVGAPIRFLAENVNGELTVVAQEQAR